MKKEHIAAAINNISDKYLFEAMDSITDNMTQNPNEVSNTNMQKHFTLKRVAVLAVAACLVLALGITVYATNDSFASWFKGVFSGPPAQENVYKRISASNLAPCTSNGTTITPVAAIADNTTCYIRLRIDAPEGTNLNIPDENDGYLQLANDSYDLLVNKETGKIESGCYALHWMDNVPGDNSIDVVITFYGQTATGLTHFNDNKMRTVNIHSIWLQDSYKNYSIVLKGDWSFDVVFPAGETKSLDVKGLEIQGLSAGEKMTLTQMSISPLSLDVSYRFTTPDEDMLPGPGTILVVMKDGTEIGCAAGGGEDGNGWTHSTYILHTLIDVRDVDYIQFGNQQIKVN